MSTTRYNPVELLKAWGLPHEHVTFNPKLAKGTRQYRIFRRQTHDGTLLFTQEVLKEILVRIGYQFSFWAKDPAWPHSPMRYEVGWLKIRHSYGQVDLNCGRYPGVHEYFSMPVIARWRS